MTELEQKEIYELAQRARRAYEKLASEEEEAEPSKSRSKKKKKKNRAAKEESPFISNNVTT